MGVWNFLTSIIQYSHYLLTTSQVGDENGHDADIKRHFIPTNYIALGHFVSKNLFICYRLVYSIVYTMIHKSYYPINI